MPPTSDDPWYGKGLAFTCQGCGSCCRGPGGYVWLNDEEIRALAAALGLDLDAFGRRYLRRTPQGLALIDSPAGDCVLLGEDGHCRVYEARPRQCRTYPWWPEVIGKASYWKNEQRHCPGIGKGHMHTSRETQKALERLGDCP